MSPSRILVVEDDFIESMDIQRCLESFGYEVVGVASYGEEAVKMANDLRPDLILMDIVLKGDWDGIESYEKIKYLDIPVIYLTASSDKASMQKAMLTGPYAYLIKPFESHDLKIALELALYKHGMEKELKESKSLSGGLFNNLQSPVYIQELQEQVWIFSEVNEAMVNMFGYSADYLNGKSLEAIAASEGNDMQQIQEYAADTYAGNPQRFDFWGKRSNGEIFPVEINLYPGSYGDKPMIMGVMVDITDKSSLKHSSKTHTIPLSPIITGPETSEYAKTETQWKESAEKYAMLFDQAQDMITLNLMKENGLPGKFLEVNKAGLERLGYSKDEFLEMTPADIIALDKRADILKNAMDLEEKGYVNFEIVHVTKKGKKIPVEVNNHIFQWNGEKVALAISRDITQRKKAYKKMEEALQEKEILLNEIHHRVKNNMQIISSLLSLQKRFVDDEDAVNILKESQNRVKSMAIIHEKLYQSSDITRINFADYLRSLVADLFYSYYIDNHQIRPFMEIDDIKLNIETAVPLGLIISEIVSNSLKYAFPDGRTGEVYLSLRTLDNGYEMIIGDDGIGFPADIEFRKTESLGMQLVNSLIKQLDGDIELDRTNGTSFIIRFKELNS